MRRIKVDWFAVFTLKVKGRKVFQLNQKSHPVRFSSALKGLHEPLIIKSMLQRFLSCGFKHTVIIIEGCIQCQKSTFFVKR